LIEIYDIAGNTLVGAASLGAVGLDWQLGGFAADPPTNNSGDIGQLVQAMAGFGGGPCRLECCRTVITTYRRLVKRFLPIWQHHHLIIASTTVPIIR